MSGNFAQLTILGNIGNVKELRYTDSGIAVQEFSVAINSGRGDDETTQWYTVTAWREYAENLANNLPNMKTVLVVGTPKFETYENKNGDIVVSVKINASTVTCAEWRADGQGDDRPRAQQQGQGRGGGGRPQQGQRGGNRPQQGGRQQQGRGQQQRGGNGRRSDNLDEFFS